MNVWSRLLRAVRSRPRSLPTRQRRPFAPEALEDRCTPSSGLTSIAFNFNPTPVAAGSTVWFSSDLQAHGLGNGPVTLQFTNQTISFTANGTNYTLNVPNSTVVFSPATTVATTTFNAANNLWTTAVPSNLGGNQFLGGVALSVPGGLPGNISNVTWQGQMQSDTANVQVQWQWAAADYTNFSGDYTTLNVKPCDDGHASSYQNGDHAGTPEAFKASLAAGATGDGHPGHFTGNPGPNAQLTPNFLPASGSSSSNITYIPGTSTDYPFTSSNPLTSVAFNESDVLTAAAMNLTNGTFDVWYTDEHALTLGVNQVTVIAANGTSTTTTYPVTALSADPGVATNPAVGAPNGTDPAGRPLAPSLYISDITNNPNNRSGDWQYGGSAIAPSAVFGTWKSYTETIDYTHGGQITLSGANDPAQNQWNLGAGADTPPSGLHTEGYAAEVRWSLSDLAKQGILLPGHNYRFYVMVHDGDQNKSGGDVGQASYQLINPAPQLPAPPPVTATSRLSGYVFLDNNGTGVFGAGDTGFAGVAVTLTGTDYQGHAVSRTVTTDSNGFYSFSGLLAGTYRIGQPFVPGYLAGTSSVGTVNNFSDGAVQSDNSVGQILLSTGDQGINYNFGLMMPST